MDQKPAVRYCPQRAVTVASHVGFAQCIAKHQCFSDDPCPLAQEFAVRAAHADATLSGAPSAPGAAAPDQPQR